MTATCYLAHIKQAHFARTCTLGSMAAIPQICKVMRLVHQLLLNNDCTSKLEAHIPKITSLVSSIGKDEVNFSESMISKSKVLVKN